MNPITDDLVDGIFKSGKRQGCVYQRMADDSYNKQGEKMASGVSGI
jgi:hypothetical protein